MKSVWPVIAVIVFAAACRDDGAPPRSTDKPRARRVIKPPSGKIRAVPPHAISPGRVGPFKIGAPLNRALDLVSGGPRIVVVNLEGVLSHHYIPAEDGAIIVGASHSDKPISFISVLDAKIAKTKSGISVGATVSHLEKLLGPRDIESAALRDPRIVSFAKLPTVRFVVNEDRTRAAMISGTPQVKAPEPVSPPKLPDEPKKTGAKKPAKQHAQPPPPKTCDVKPLLAHGDAILAEAGTTRFSNPQLMFGCFVNDEPGAMVRDGRSVIIVGGEKDKFRVVARITIPSLTFAATLDVDEDQRHEVAVARVDRSRKRLVARIDVFRIEPNRFQKVASKAIYVLSREAVEWTGARLADIELLLELAVRNRKLRVTGLYLHAGKARPRMVAPLIPVAMRVRMPRVQLRPPPPRSDRDAGVTPRTRDAGVRRMGVDAGLRRRPGNRKRKR